MLLVAESETGYLGVRLAKKPGLSKPYEARVSRSGKRVSLGSFATAEEAALCVARTPEGQAAAVERAAAATPLTSEEARQQALVEGLVLRVARSPEGQGQVGARSVCQEREEAELQQLQLQEKEWLQVGREPALASGRRQAKACQCMRVQHDACILSLSCLCSSRKDGARGATHPRQVRLPRLRRSGAIQDRHP